MHVLFYKNKRYNFFYGYNILTGGVFVTQLSTNAGFSVRRMCGLRQTAVSRAIRHYQNQIYFIIWEIQRKLRNFL